MNPGEMKNTGGLLCHWGSAQSGFTQIHFQNENKQKERYRERKTEGKARKEQKRVCV